MAKKDHNCEPTSKLYTMHAFKLMVSSTLSRFLLKFWSFLF
jgi:hypothetical protein